MPPDRWGNWGLEAGVESPRWYKEGWSWDLNQQFSPQPAPALKHKEQPPPPPPGAGPSFSRRRTWL